MMPRISIVIPCYNEESNVEAVREALYGELDIEGLALEIIYVDDGSRDSTWDAIGTMASQDENVKGIRLSNNFGKESAIAAGLDAADCDAAIIMDADLQHPPALIPEMLRAWEGKGVDIVEAVKVQRGKEPLSYRIASNTFNFFMNKLSGFEFSGATDFKLISRRVIDEYRAISERNIFFRGIISWMGFRTVRIPFEVNDRREGQRKWSFIKLFNLAMMSIMAYSNIPLRFVTVLGMVLLMFSLVIGTRALIVKYYYNVLDGITLLILINIFIGSVIMISLGIIGEYIANIYKEVKRRPRYLVKDTLNVGNKA
jgi:dolichol-phosphate mannosyltransferase